MESEFINARSPEIRRRALEKVRREFSNLADHQQSLLLIWFAQRELLLVLLGVRRAGLSADLRRQLEQTTHSTELIFMTLARVVEQCIPRARLTAAQKRCLSELGRIPDEVFRRGMAVEREG